MKSRLVHICLLICVAFLSAFSGPARAAGEMLRITVPPLGERWFSIAMGTDQVGFYRQLVTALPEGGYRFEGSGSVRMKIMGFAKESSSRESYLVGSNLALKSFEVEQTINGARSRLNGVLSAGVLQVRRTADGKTTQRALKVKGEVIPGPALNLVPLFRGVVAGRQYRVQTFDPEEMTVKEVKMTALGTGVTPDGLPSLRLRNNLYPFVDNEIWIDREGNTLLESVRDGLVVTRAETAGRMAAYISAMALAKKDLIYDFSLVRITPPLLQPPADMAGLVVAVDGYPAQVPLLKDGWQQAERTAEGRLLIKTGISRTVVAGSSLPPDGRYLQPAEGIEAAAPEITAQARELTAMLQAERDKARVLAAWTASWLEDDVEDAGSALAGFRSKRGNCQTHAKLYIALARAAGIPTRFVSGLVSRDGSSFLYHSWAESWLEGGWLAIDPTFGQLPADPSHLAFFEGNLPADLSPLVAIIGNIRLTLLEQQTAPPPALPAAAAQSPPGQDPQPVR